MTPKRKLAEKIAKALLENCWVELTMAAVRHSRGEKYDRMSSWNTILAEIEMHLPKQPKKLSDLTFDV